MARAMAVFSGEGVTGSITLTQSQEDAPTIFTGELSGLSPGKHAIALHTFGDFSQGFMSAGAIFNPFGKSHGAPEDNERKVGDLGNVTVGADGTCSIKFEDKLVKLIGPHSVIGRCLILKEKEDDLGKGGHELSLQDGNAGARVAGAVIGIAQSI